jgi:hypothetical protein
MRASSTALGLYVPGHGGMGAFIPAASGDALTSWYPGMGDFIPSFSNPNSLAAGITDWMPKTLGDFVSTAAMYAIPANSVTAGAATMNYQEGLNMSGDSVTYAGGVSQSLSGLKGDCGCGCGGHGGCGDSHGGMGAITTDLSNLWTDATSGNWSAAWTDFTTLLEEPLFGTSVPVWMVGGGLLLVWALLFSGGAHSRYQRGRRASSAAARAYA